MPWYGTSSTSYVCNRPISTGGPSSGCGSGGVGAGVIGSLDREIRWSCAVGCVPVAVVYLVRAVLGFGAVVVGFRFAVVLGFVAV